jgi:hypothetical protein
MMVDSKRKVRRKKMFSIFQLLPTMILPGMRRSLKVRFIIQISRPPSRHICALLVFSMRRSKKGDRLMDNPFFAKSAITERASSGAAHKAGNGQVEGMIPDKQVKVCCRM